MPRGWSADTTGMTPLVGVLFRGQSHRGDTGVSPGCHVRWAFLWPPI
ncbi:MAG: hypothetical protein ACTSU5_21725 [Promethearchaeota archaeon]